MIENLFGGGGGGGLQGVTAGTGISVDNTNPDNPIITNTSLNTDEVAKVSSNDTTAGYLNGKLVAGSGISLTENNNGGNETLGIAVSNLDASAITTGTIATARLGTGTANSTTYLAGDQTYKAAVTSVNGQTGAVTVAAGDTTYTVTVADAENTTNDITIASFTVPANTWNDGELVWLEYYIHINNGTGGNVNLTNSVYTSGTQQSTYTQSIITGGVNYHLVRRYYYRLGSNIYTATASQQTTYGAMNGGNYSNSAYWSLASAGAYAATFSSDIALAIKAQWATASSIVYLRVLNARAYKQTGQVT